MIKLFEFVIWICSDVFKLIDKQWKFTHPEFNTTRFLIIVLSLGTVAIAYDIYSLHEKVKAGKSIVNPALKSNIKIKNLQ